MTEVSNEVAASRRWREAAVRRLLELETAGRLTRAQVRLVAGSVGVTERTVRRWLNRARVTGQVTAGIRDRFRVDDAIRRRLADLRGNVSALHRELAAVAAAGGPPSPSMATLRRALARDVTPAVRPRLRGEGGRRLPAMCRNVVWEAARLAAPLEVGTGGGPVRPWITWFVDRASHAVCGTVVSPGPPGREPVLAALRAAISMTEPYGPPGGLPLAVHTEPSDDELRTAIRAALGALAVDVVATPLTQARAVARAARSSFECSPPMTYEAFTAALLDWVRRWNSEQPQGVLGRRAPLEAWLADPALLSTLPAEHLRLLIPRGTHTGAERPAPTPPPDPGQATTVDGLVERLRSLKVWAGSPSYETIKDRVNATWAMAGRSAGEMVGKTTVVDSFRLGRRRLSTDLVIAVVQALHPDVGYVAQWRQALQVIGGESAAAGQVRVQDTLPPDLATFTGRAPELERLRRALAGAQQAGARAVISVIEGMAGVGKTQLAIHAAHMLDRERPFDRVLFVNLRGFHPDPAQPPADPAAVLDAFLRLLGVAGHRIPHDLDARAALYRRRVGGMSALIVLDNAANANQVRPLLPGTAGCAVLVTSRRSLCDLDPVACLAIDVFTTDEGRTFLARTASEVPAGDDPGAPTRIVEACGHLPLALGLVAGHIRAKPGWTLTDHAIWLEERHRDRRLDTGVELALDLSYHHLPADRRRLLRLLALHPGHDVDAYAAAALAGTDLDTARAHLNHLCGDHLLQQGIPGRHTFHDLVRAYATIRAHDEDRPADRHAVLTRLFDHYLATAAAAMSTLHPAEAHLRPEIAPAAAPAPDLADPDTALAWLDAERHTLVAIAGHTAAHGWPDLTVRLSRTLFRYLTSGHPTDAMAVHGHALRAGRRTGDRLGQAHALTDLGAAHLRLGRPAPAAEHYRQALELFRQIRDPAGEARTVNNLGIVEAQTGHYGAAAAHYSQALRLYGKAGDPAGEARSLNNLAFIEKRLGRYEAATEHYAQALDVVRGLGDRDSEGYSLINLADVETRAGWYEPAGHHLRQALTHLRQLGNRTGEANALDGLGLLHTRLGEPGRAAEHHQHALRLFRETGYRHGEAWARNGLGEAALAAGCPADALAHHGAARAIAADIGVREQLARADTGLGHAHHALADPDRAREHYRLALTVYTELGAPEANQLRTLLDNIDPPTPPSES